MSLLGPPHLKHWSRLRKFWTPHWKSKWILFDWKKVQELQFTLAQIQSCKTFGGSPGRPSLGRLYCINARYWSLNMRIPCTKQKELKLVRFLAMRSNTSSFVFAIWASWALSNFEWKCVRKIAKLVVCNKKILLLTTRYDQITGSNPIIFWRLIHAPLQVDPWTLDAPRIEW